MKSICDLRVGLCRNATTQL